MTEYTPAKTGEYPSDIPQFLKLRVMQLTKRTWFSVVCSLIENDTRHHGGQNVDSRGAACSFQSAS